MDYTKEEKQASIHASEYVAISKPYLLEHSVLVGQSHPVECKRVPFIKVNNIQSLQLNHKLKIRSIVPWQIYIHQGIERNVALALNHSQKWCSWHSSKHTESRSTCDATDVGCFDAWLSYLKLLVLIALCVYHWWHIKSHKVALVSILISRSRINWIPINIKELW